MKEKFLLTPLREGRRRVLSTGLAMPSYFYSRPCGRGDWAMLCTDSTGKNFYSRPCGRGDDNAKRKARVKFQISTHAPAGGATRRKQRRRCRLALFLLTPLREGRLLSLVGGALPRQISTHAPAGGATAIFHKSVMRFCGKLPKDDTVLCLASFGFPRRDPKAVYLAWISCANLPQKCVRQGLALKDQGTSCFHEGLASHAFDPVLV